MWLNNNNRISMLLLVCRSLCSELRLDSDGRFGSLVHSICLACDRFPGCFKTEPLHLWSISNRSRGILRSTILFRREPHVTLCNDPPFDRDQPESNWLSLRRLFAQFIAASVCLVLFVFDEHQNAIIGFGWLEHRDVMLRGECSKQLLPRNQFKAVWYRW